MEPLTWTGSIGTVFDPAFLAASGVLILSLICQIVLAYAAPSGRLTVNPDGTIAVDASPYVRVSRFTGWSLLAVVAMIVIYILAGVVLGAEGAGIVGGISSRLLPVWIVLVVLFALSIILKRRLGLYGKLFDSTVGMIGFGLVMFWVFTALFGAMGMIVTHESLSQVSGMKNAVPGTPLSRAGDGEYAWYLLGGDNLARDVFSRIVMGGLVVVQIAPLATLFAFMVGITLVCRRAITAAPST